MRGLPEDEIGQNIDRGVGAENDKDGPPLNAERLKLQRLARMALGLNALGEIFPTVRFNQIKGLQAFTDFVRSGETGGYFRMPTGAGKTILLALIASMLNETCLILVSSVNLLKSTKKEMERIGIDADKIGIVGDGSNEINRQFTVMTYKGFLSRGVPQGTTTCIFDEVHRSLGEKTRQKIDAATGGEMELITEVALTEEEQDDEEDALERIHQMKGQILKLGFTATPQLGSKNVEEIHGKLIAETSYAELVAAGFLKKVHVHEVSAELDEEDEASYMNLENEEKLLKKAAIYRKILEAYSDFYVQFTDYPLRTVAFCHSVAACTVFSDLAEDFGLRCAIVTGQSGDLAQAEADLLAGRKDIIITVNKLMEGWDFPPINTVLWLRGSWSPAVLIQGAGRGMRAYLEEGFMHLFETEWRVSRRSSTKPPSSDDGAEVMSQKGEGEGGGSRPSKRALTFAQALATLGEDVEKIISNAPHLEYIYYCELNEQGVGVLKDGSEVLGLEAYAKLRRTANSTLRKWLEEKGIAALKGVKGKAGTRTFELYKKTEIDGVMNEKRPEVVVSLDENGACEIEDLGRGIGLHAYAKRRGFEKRGLLEDWIREAESPPQSIPGIKGRYGSKTVELYLEEALDQLVGKIVELDEGGSYELEDGTRAVTTLSKLLSSSNLTERHLKTSVQSVQGLRGKHQGSFFKLYLESDIENFLRERPVESKNLVPLDANGIGILADGTEVVGLVAYARSKRLGDSTLKNWIVEAGLNPVQDVQGSRPPATISIFRKSEIDAIIQSKQAVKIVDLDDNGIATLEDGRVVVGLNAYAPLVGVSPVTLIALVEKRGVPALTEVKGRRGRWTIDIFLKELIDKELPVQLDQNGVGILDDGREVVLLSAYLEGRRIHWANLITWLTERGINPVEGRKGIRSRRSAEIYLKTEIDAMLNVHGKL